VKAECNVAAAPVRLRLGLVGFMQPASFQGKADVDWVSKTYFVLLIIGALSTAPLGAVIWRRRRAPGSAAVAIALFGCTIWIIGYLGELQSTNLQAAIPFANLEGIGLTVIPEAWLIFILQYAGLQNWLTRRNLALITTVTAVVIVMILTNEIHHIMWTYISLMEVGPFHRVDMAYGIGFWVYVVFAYAMIGVATFLTLQLMARANTYYRLQVMANVVAAVIPWGASLHDLLHFAPLPYLDLTPLAFTFTCAILAWNLFRWRMADLLPIARGVILESMEDALVVVDANGLVVDLNHVASHLIGRPETNVVGLPLERVWPDLDRALARPAHEAGSRGEPFKQDDRFFDIKVSPLRDLRGGLVGRVLSLRDVTARLAVESALRLSETRYALAVQGANDGLWDWDLSTPHVYFSPRALDMLGLPEPTTLYTLEDVYAQLEPTDVPRLRADIEAHLESRSPYLESEFRVGQGIDQRWLLCRGLTVQDNAGNPYRMAGSLTDITTRKTSETQLRHAALHDSLTGLGNRSLLMDRLEHALQRARRDRNQSFALLYLDLDRFKMINDSLGHAAGDRVLQEIARRLAITFREADTLVRLGGDEFVVLLEGVQNLQGAERAAERFQETIARPIQIGNFETYSSASIGIALANKPHSRAVDMLRDADLALYQAKRLGGGRYVFFDQRMHQRAMTEFELETDLRRAMDAGSLAIYYQPICSLVTRQISGFEALLRWNHPTRGMLLPKDFLSLAEDTGLIIPIGSWVLEQAIHQLARWKGAYPEYADATMGVNLSGRQLAQDNLDLEVQRAVETSGVAASDLHLEITETLMIEDSVLAAHRLSKLQRIGVKLHLDDFGTGYSSLSLLHTFPVDCLKIDRTFVARLESGGRDAQIVQTIVALAGAFEVEVVAEGIETEDQLIRLVALGCTAGQGYLLGKPAPAEEIDALLASISPSSQLKVLSVD
jgi:diguanylate cyclase (GGDEF)-like protein/PAS domain S-box-containing protein